MTEENEGVRIMRQILDDASDACAAALEKHKKLSPCWMTESGCVNPSHFAGPFCGERGKHVLGLYDPWQVEIVGETSNGYKVEIRELRKPSDGPNPPGL